MRSASFLGRFIRAEYDSRVGLFPVLLVLILSCVGRIDAENESVQNGSS